MACKNHPDRESVAACVSCGAELCAECDKLGADGKSYCAEDLPAAAPEVSAPEAPAAAAAPVTPPVVAPAPAAETGGGNMLLAALGYPIWICALIAVLIEKNDRQVKYHAWNALFWGLGYVVVVVALGIVGAVLSHIPIIGAVFHLVVWAVVPLAYLVLSIMFAIRATNGQDVTIPVVSDLARKQAGL